MRRRIRLVTSACLASTWLAHVARSLPEIVARASRHELQFVALAACIRARLYDPRHVMGTTVLLAVADWLQSSYTSPIFLHRNGFADGRQKADSSLSPAWAASCLTRSCGPAVAFHAPRNGVSGAMRCGGTVSAVGSCAASANVAGTWEAQSLVTIYHSVIW